MDDTLLVLFAGWFLYDVVWWSICDYYRDFKQWRSSNG